MQMTTDVSIHPSRALGNATQGHQGCDARQTTLGNTVLCGGCLQMRAQFTLYRLLPRSTPVARAAEAGLGPAGRVTCALTD